MSADTSDRLYTVQHMTIVSDKAVGAVHDDLLKVLPKLEATLVEMLRAGDQEQIAEQRNNGPKLWLFETRDHGSLLAADGGPRTLWQFEIGNPLTAETMTRYSLAAGLYAPLRVVLYEDDNGRAVFEYDLPSTLLGQFADERVTRVAEALDRDLDEALHQALR